MAGFDSYADSRLGDIDRANAAIDALPPPAPDVLAELFAIAKTSDAPAFWRALSGKEAALAIVKESRPAEYLAWRSEIKTACPGISVREIDKLVTPKGEGDSSAATELADLAASRCDLWHDAEMTGFASITRDGHREHWRIESTGFRDWLAFLAHSELGKAPSSETVKAAGNALAGSAKFEGEEHIPARRVARDPSGYWIDMGDDAWRAILTTQAGWKVIDQPPIRFLRTKTTKPLPMPVSGNLESLWTLTNIPESERLLVLAWILECYRADTPYALLELCGEQGSAKSSTQKILRQFIDPNTTALRGRPKSTEDIFVAAANTHLLSYENLSGLSNDQSDALCVCATGGGYAARQLYTNGEESTLSAHCPVVLNGISPVVTRPDLLDRALSVTLPIITTSDRRTDRELEADLEQAEAAIFGGLLDLFAQALALLPSVKLDTLPRMADFALLGEAVARSLGHPDGHFLSLYEDHQREAVGRTIDANPIAAAMADYIERGNEHRGLVKGLLDDLMRSKADHEKDDYWPRSPKGMADAIRRYAPALRQIGIIARVEGARRKDGIHCVLAKQAGGVCAQPGIAGNEVHEVHQVHQVHQVHPNPQKGAGCPGCNGAGCHLCDVGEL